MCHVLSIWLSRNGEVFNKIRCYCTRKEKDPKKLECRVLAETAATISLIHTP
jgi:hypothetical protein